MKEEINYDLLGKYLNSECSEEEVKTINLWLSDPSNSRIYEEFRIVWNISQKTRAKFEPDKEKAWQKINSRINEQKRFSLIHDRKKETYSFIYKIAAFFIFGVALYLIYNQFSKEQYQEDLITYSFTKDTNKFTLPDGSEVWLSERSKIEFKKEYSAKVREVNLIGEAFFDVVKDSSKPFTVSTTKTKVTVLGTSFSYKTGEGFDEVIVNTGKVSFTEKVNSSNEVIVRPGNKATYDHVNKVINKTVIDNENYFFWKTGRLIFENEKFSKVIDEVSKYYNRKIIILDKILNDTRITVTFDNQPIKNVLKTFEILFEKNILDTSNVIIIP